MLLRKLSVEFIGTFVLVFFAVGVATLTFGFKLAGSSTAAGVLLTGLAFGLVLLALVYAIGPISGCHVNPAVTIGFVLSGRMPPGEALGYWGAQLLGGLAGAGALYAVFTGASGYDTGTQGLGADGWGPHSIVGLSEGGAFVAEVILTALFVLIVLSATSHVASAGFAGLAIGMGLTVVHLIGIPLTGTSVNPARSLGPAIVVGGDALSQVWLFIVAPLIGGALAAGLWLMLISERPESAAAGQVLGSDIVA